MAVADIVMIAVLLVFLLFGIRKGFVRSLVGLVGSVASIVLAAVFSPRFLAAVQPYLKKWISFYHPNPVLDRVLAAVVLFILLEILVELVAGALDSLCRLPGLRQINALLGGVLGLLKGAVFVLIICAIFQIAVPFGGDQMIQKQWMQIDRSGIYRITYTHNPVYELLQSDLWNEVGKNEKQE